MVRARFSIIIQNVVARFRVSVGLEEVEPENVLCLLEVVIQATLSDQGWAQLVGSHRILLPCAPWS